MTGLSRQYVKLCDVRDFEDARLLGAAHEIVPGRDERTVVERKLWEFAMLAMFLEDVGRIGDDTEVLGVAAGNEEVLYWLANRVARVMGTDIYGEGRFSGREAAASMLEDATAHAPYPYREDRLEIRHMDARELDFPDESFDVVYSLSSIEHFGSAVDIARAAAEIGRVLRPGGHAFIVTECFVKLHPLDSAPIDLARRRRAGSLGHRRAAVAEIFTPRELERRIVEPSGLELMQQLDRRLSSESWENLTRLVATPSEVRLEAATGTYYPHVLLQVRRSVFTSVCLALEKPGPV